MKGLILTVSIVLAACGQGESKQPNEVIVDADSETPASTPISESKPIADADSVTPAPTPIIKGDDSTIRSVYNIAETAFVPLILDTKRFNAFTFYHGISRRVIAPCGEQAADAAVILVMGQSNASNYVDKPSGIDTDRVKTVFDGKCWKHAEPLLGSQGAFPGNNYSYVAKKLIDENAFSTVYIINVAFGGTYIDQWARGDKQSQITWGIKSAIDAGLSITHVIWHQGEADALTDYDTYRARLSEVIASVRGQGVKAPFYVATVSACTDGVTHDNVRNAQASVVDGISVFAGPDADRYVGSENRFDGCHFNQKAARELANDWYAILKP